MIKNNKKVDTKRNKKQIKKRGFSDADLWNLDITVAEFILPRLKRYKKINSSFPSQLSKKKWEKYLSEMITAFSIISSSDYFHQDARKNKKVRKGLKLFIKYYSNLWI